MCRMCFLATSEPITRAEAAFHNVWSRGNSDGLGIGWRDYKTKEFVVVKYPVNSDMREMALPYDRLLLHARSATFGEGQHPLKCECKKGESTWYITHNGMVHGHDDIKKRLEKDGHKFSDKYIDSEVMVHLWMEAKGDSLAKRLKDYGKLLKEYKVGGMLNLLGYNPQTDEWFACSDGSLVLTNVKGRAIAITSDKEWLNEEGAKSLKAEVADIPMGNIKYGDGLKHGTITGAWEPHEDAIKVTTYDDFGFYAGNRFYPYTPKNSSASKNKGLYSAQETERAELTFDSSDGMVYIAPQGCACNANTGDICNAHWAAGYRNWTQDGCLARKRSFVQKTILDMSAKDLARLVDMGPSAYCE